LKTNFYHAVCQDLIFHGGKAHGAESLNTLMGLEAQWNDYVKLSITVSLRLKPLLVLFEIRAFFVDPRFQQSRWSILEKGLSYESEDGIFEVDVSFDGAERGPYDPLSLRQ